MTDIQRYDGAGARAFEVAYARLLRKSAEGTRPVPHEKPYYPAGRLGASALGAIRYLIENPGANTPTICRDVSAAIGVTEKSVKNVLFQHRPTCLFRNVGSGRAANWVVTAAAEKTLREHDRMASQ